MKYCIKCGTAIADEAGFCPSCGAKQLEISSEKVTEATLAEQTFEKVTGEVVSTSTIRAEGSGIEPDADMTDKLGKAKGFLGNLFTKIATWIVKYNLILTILVLLINLWNVINCVRRIMAGGKFHFSYLLAAILGLAFIALEGMFGLKGSNSIKDNYTEEKPFLIKEHLAPVVLFCLSNLVFANKTLKLGVFFVALILFVVGVAVSYYQKNSSGMDSSKLLDAVTEELAVGIAAALMVDILLIVLGVLAGVAMWLVGLALLILFLPLIIRLILICIWIN